MVYRDMEKRQEEGLVVRVTGSEVRVAIGSGVVSCALRGRLRRFEGGFQVVAGDQVVIARGVGKGGVGVVEKVIPRRSWLSRFDAGRESAERVIVSNLDTLFVVASVKSPEVHYQFLDRVLASAERGKIHSCVCLNKIDLVDEESDVIEELKAIYESCGYTVILTSALNGDGISALKKMLQGGIYAFIGESGVGKSSILMKIDPSLDLKIGELALKTGRGRHTTSFSQLYQIKGGYIADTPGIQTFGFPGKQGEELASCFPEFAQFEGNCRFRPCTHSHEPECSVKKAQEEGLINQTRYRSYLWLLKEIEGRERRRFS